MIRMSRRDWWSCCLLSIFEVVVIVVVGLSVIYVIADQLL